MKTITVISSASVYNDPRVSKDIVAFAEAGYHINVLAWNRDGKAEKMCQEVFGKQKGSINFYFYNYLTLNGIGFKKMHILFSYIMWVKRMLKKLGNTDVVHACNLDCGIPAYLFTKKNKNVKFVYDIFDYYIDSHSMPSFMKNIIESIEIKVINSADVTIICNDERRQQIEKSSPKKLIIIHNSPEIEEIVDVEEKYDYSYCGVLSNGRLIEEIFDLYPENSDLKFCFAGYAGLMPKAQQLSETYENFEFLGSVLYSQALDIESRSRVIAAVYDPSYRNHKLCAPNKFYEALALSKPIIVCKGTGIDRIVEENNIGIVIDYDASQFYDAVNYFKNNKDIAVQMGQRARKIYDSKYKWSLMKEILLEAYKELA